MHNEAPFQQSNSPTVAGLYEELACYGVKLSFPFSLPLFVSSSLARPCFHSHYCTDAHFHFLRH
jgi:hypothetical protein